MSAWFKEPNFLDEETCRRVLKVHERGPEYACSTAHLVVENDVRLAFAVRAEHADLPDIFDRITSKIDEHYAVSSALWPGSSEIFRYPVGPGFGWHRDDQLKRGNLVQRARRAFFSFVILLNSGYDGDAGYDGGALVFESGERIAARRGLLVAWPASLRHSVTPILSGERFVLSGANLAE